MEISAENINKKLGGAVSKAPRSSNLELYRIVCMLMIVAHHYVVNSGLASKGGPFWSDFTSGNSFFLLLFGAWGKTGINCFLMITGYFMCTSKITLRKFLKLMGQIYLYSSLIFILLFLYDYESLSAPQLVKLIFPLWGFKTNFISCFIGFWLTIPFLNILVRNMTKRQHECLLFLLFGMFTILGSIPTFLIGMEYIIWFGIIYLLASYIRLYPRPVFENRKIWGWLTLLGIFLAVMSVIAMRILVPVSLINYFVEGNKIVSLSYYFVADSNKIFAVIIALCSFLWFKNMKIGYNKIINAFGAGTFGVLLIHANSDAMRQWLWKDFVDVIGHYKTLTTGELALYSICVVLAIFVICNLIDQFRIATLEKWFFNWYDSKFAPKADKFVNRILQN